MNIPLDNLYHWIRGLANEPVSIYTFSPHGSKNITNLRLLGDEDSNAISPELVCHDQEPLNFDSLQNLDLFKIWLRTRKFCPEFSSDDPIFQTLNPQYYHLNFYTVIRGVKPRSIFDRYILLHSEKNSIDVEKFSINAEPVYYWSHGLISRDWYRFAEYDPRLSINSDTDQTFLIYCRAWTGTREYRLKFLDLLIDHGLISNCRTSILHHDQGHNLDSYQCVNKKLQPNNINQILSIPNNCHFASASASYDPKDIVETNISVVLETVADNTKIHLTEKTLRPIACGHPFILIAGPGALEYLKSYGFKTFSPWINEDYDQETDAVQRMQLVAKEMHRIQNLPTDQKNQLLKKIKKIAKYNQNYFFSTKFTNKICTELTENLNQAICAVKNTKGHKYLELLRAGKKYRNRAGQTVEKQKKNFEILKILRQLRKDPTTSIKDLINQYPPGFFNS
jgi:hypothetical protein